MCFGEFCNFKPGSVMQDSEPLRKRMKNNVPGTADISEGTKVTTAVRILRYWKITPISRDSFVFI